MPTIVLADDHEVVRQGVRSLLEGKNGFKIVGEAANGIEALRLTTDLKPDVLITDLRMPQMDGIEVTRKVKESLGDVKVVILSMYGEEAYVYSALLAGASAYVLKRSGIHNLNAAIDKVLQGGKYLSPPLTEKAIEAYAFKRGKPSLTDDRGF